MIKSIIQDGRWKFNDEATVQYLQQQKGVTLSSGYFAPLHLGHVKYLEESSRYGNINIVAVNSDASLMRKKGFVALKEEERAIIVSSLKWVDYAIIWDGDNVAELINILKPKYFTNGGDRSELSNINKLELEACNNVGCKILVGVGGNKKENSSSNIIENIIKNYKILDV